MKNTVVRFVAATTFAIGIAGVAYAGDHLTPGTPGDKNCQGQTTAYLAQAARNGLVDDAFHGIGGIGRFADLSVQEVKDVIQEFCAQ